MKEIKCYLFDIIDPDPVSIGLEKWNNVFESMINSGLMGVKEHRYGFVENVQYDEFIAGSFISEGKRQTIQYSDDKRLIDVHEIPSFESVFFAIMTDTSQILFQNRNIYGYKDLGMAKIRENLLIGFATLLRLNNIHISSNTMRIEKAGESYTQEELYEFFLQNKIIQIEVKNLSQTNIPSQNSKYYNLYNPKVELNEITWGAVADSIQGGIDKIIIDSSDRINTDFSKGPITKAIAQTGEIEEIKSIQENNEVVIRNRTADEELTISIPYDGEITKEIVISILKQIREKQETRERILSWQRRREKFNRDRNNGPLFKEDN